MFFLSAQAGEVTKVKEFFSSVFRSEVEVVALSENQQGKQLAGEKTKFIDYRCRDRYQQSLKQRIVKRRNTFPLTLSDSDEKESEGR